MQLNLTLEDVIKRLEPVEVIGQTTALIQRIAALSEAKLGDLSFLGNKKYKLEVSATEASVVLLPLDYEGTPKDNQVFIKIKDPSESLSKLCSDLEKELFKKPAAGIHPSAIIHPSVVIDPTCTIGPCCVIEEGSKIGKNTVLVAQVYLGRFAEVGGSCFLMPHVTVLDYCVLGNRVRIHSGTVVGSDGFGYHTVNGVHHKEPQIGRVVIEDDVEIGSNTSIDRARFSETRIGKGVKIDNLVQVAHNVIIGSHSIIVSQAGIAGSTCLENHVVLGGQAGVAGHLKIGAGAMVGGQSGVNHDLPPKSYVRGSPALPFQKAMRYEILQRRLPELFARVSELEKLLSISHSSSTPCETQPD